MTEHTSTGAGHGRAVMPIIRMRARSRDEDHRASTPLELFFDPFSCGEGRNVSFVDPTEFALDCAPALDVGARWGR